MGQGSRAHATPSSRRRLALLICSLGQAIFRYRFHIAVDLAVVGLVLALPIAGGAAAPSPSIAAAASVEAAPVASVAGAERPRAQVVSRSLTGSGGGEIVAAVPPDTAIAGGVKPIPEYTLRPNDTLESIGSSFGVSAGSIAASNGITDPTLKNQSGRTIKIPPGEGALYFVKTGDTIASVAERFEVDPKAIMDYNRLYFEPEHFAPDQLIFVPGAKLPALVYVNVSRGPGIIARPPAQVDPQPNGRLQYPVRGFHISQYFWSLHLGVDLAAPYGSPIAASDDGVVEYAGWVAVGGLCVQIRHDGGLETGYYHMGSVYVAAGQHVTRGQIVGTIGLTGVTTGPHVHWEARLDGRLVNPLLY